MSTELHYINDRGFELKKMEIDSHNNALCNEKWSIHSDPF